MTREAGINSIWNNCFQTVGKRPHRSLSPERKETDKLNPTFSMNFYLEAISNLLHRNGNPKKYLEALLSWGDRYSCSRKLGVAGTVGDTGE